jgi:hypothetical protein
VILDRIIRAAWHEFRHFCPLGAQLIVEFEDAQVLFVGEGRFVNCLLDTGHMVARRRTNDFAMVSRLDYTFTLGPTLMKKRDSDQGTLDDGSHTARVEVVDIALTALLAGA